MKVEMLLKNAWALNPRKTLYFKAGEVVDVPEDIGKEMIKIKWGEPVKEEKANIAPAEENKMQSPGIENKEILPEGNNIESIESINTNAESNLGEEKKEPGNSESDENVDEKLKSMTKDELLVFAKRNKISIPLLTRNKDGILKAIQEALK